MYSSTAARLWKATYRTFHQKSAYRGQLVPGRITGSEYAMP